MKFVVAFAFETLEDALQFEPTYDMELVSSVKLVVSVSVDEDEINYESLCELFGVKYGCFITVRLKDECEFIYQKPDYEAAG